MATIGLDKLYYAKITEDENGDETYAAPAQLAGVEQQDFAYTYPGFETDTYTSSGLHDYVVVAMDNILNNDADVRTELESLINRLK